MDAKVVWHELECGGYSADLALWEELAREAAGPLAEVGSGTGRVAVHLAREGHQVIAIERDHELAARLERRAEAAGLPVRVIEADAREADLERLGTQVGLALAPMQVIQGLGAEARAELIAAARSWLAPGGTLAVAVIDESYLEDPAAGASPPVPEMREVDGLVFSSEPLWVQVSGEAFTVRRLRQRVDPGGELTREVHDDILHRVAPEEVERVGSRHGLEPRGRREVSSGRGEADSIVVLLGAP